MADVWVAFGAPTVSSSHPSTVASTGLGRRWTFGAVGTGLLAVLVMAGWSLVSSPTEDARGEYAIAPVEQFEPGSVSTFLWADGDLKPLPVGVRYDQRPVAYPATGPDVVHVVRLPNGEFRILSGAAVPSLHDRVVRGRLSPAY